VRRCCCRAEGRDQKRRGRAARSREGGRKGGREGGREGGEGGVKGGGGKEGRREGGREGGAYLLRTSSSYVEVVIHQGELNRKTESAARAKLGREERIFAWREGGREREREGGRRA